MDSVAQQALQVKVHDLLNRALLFHGLAVIFQPPPAGHRDAVVAALMPRDEHLVPDRQCPWRRCLAETRHAWKSVADEELPGRFAQWMRQDVGAVTMPEVWPSDFESRHPSDIERQDQGRGRGGVLPESPGQESPLSRSLEAYARLLIQEAQARARDWTARVRVARYGTSELLENQGPIWLELFPETISGAEIPPYTPSARLARAAIVAEARRLGMWQGAQPSIPQCTTGVRIHGSA